MNPPAVQAVELEPGNGAYYNHRGLTRALTGDYDGAIEDFEFYLEWGQSEQPQERLDKHQEWIEQLGAGENPFDQATLEELRGE
jgi:regulator of sirC expression with transglutaminase-like and TPR domain